MDAFNAILTGLFDVLLAALAGAPAVALIVVSIVVGVIMTIVFRYTSNQRALRRVADRTKAMLLGMRLFKDDLRTALRYQGGLLTATGLRLWHSLPPVAVLIVPVILVLVQLSVRYEHRPLEVGERAVVALRATADGWARWREAMIEPADGVTIETPGVRDDDRRMVSWRVRADDEGERQLSFRAGDETIEKAIVSAGDEEDVRLRTIETRRVGTSFWDHLVHPGEASIPGAVGIESIVVHYPSRRTPIVGVDVPWWGTFLIVSMVTALCVRPIVKVQF
jgi:hypothetical protein